MLTINVGVVGELPYWFGGDLRSVLSYQYNPMASDGKRVSRQITDPIKARVDSGSSD